MSKRGQNIYKRKDNRWEARYIKAYQSNGTPKYGYCYGKTYREAKEKVENAKAALLLGKPHLNTQAKRRFSFYCDEWLQINRSKLKESTYAKYYGILEKHIKPRLGGYLVHALSSVIIEQFGRDLMLQAKLSAKTVKDILTTLHSIIKYTAKHFSLPLQMIEFVYPKIPKNETRVLSKDEQMHFTKYLLSDMDEYKFGVLLSLLTGMRIGELCALKWENISLDEKIIKIKSTMQRLHDYENAQTNKTKIIISKPKSDASIRIIPLTDYAAKLCKMHWCARPDAFVLTGKPDKFIEPRTLQYKMEHYTSDCGLKGVHFHTLRHTFATRCVEVDFEIKSLSEILGHSNPRITLERYVHSSMELKRENMNKLATIGF